MEKNLMKLDASSRARIACMLLDSLDDLPEDETAKLWAHEAARRDREITDNSSQTRSAAAVFKSARKAMK